MALNPQEPRSGPRTGSQRPVGAPNAGAMGGRPVVGPGLSNSPMERLSSEVPIASMPPPQAATPPAAAVPGAGEGAGPGGASPGSSPTPAPGEPEETPYGPQGQPGG